MTEHDGLVPYTFVVGSDNESTKVEYHGERLPGIVAAVIMVGDVGDILDVAEDERAYLLLKIRMPYVHIRRDESTLHGGEIEMPTYIGTGVQRVGPPIGIGELVTPRMEVHIAGGEDDASDS